MAHGALLVLTVKRIDAGGVDGYWVDLGGCWVEEYMNVDRRVDGCWVDIG